MLKKWLVIFGFLAFVTSTGISKDAKSVVDDVAKTIGAADVNSIQYSGSGIYSQFGQNPSPYLPYPKFYAKVTRILDFGKGISREEMVRTQAENPPHGGGGQPLYRDASGVTVTSVNGAWGAGQPALTPQGWVKAAMATTPTLKPASVNGKPGSVVSFTMNGKYKVEGYVDADNLLTKVNTWMPNPILGDTLIETTYSGYKDFGGVKFPTKIGQKQGGFPTLDLTVSEVHPNAPVPEIRVPGPPPPAKVESQKIADGVWYLAGTPDPNSQVVEFKDFIVTIESSVTEGRALANIAEAKRLVPNKPIRYHVNSHHHSDHAAGLRANVIEGATIITHELNKKFYEDTVLKSPHPGSRPVFPESEAGEVYLGERQICHHRWRPHAGNLLCSRRRTHGQSPDVLPAQGKNPVYHRYLQSVWRAPPQRSSARDRQSVLCGSWGEPQTAESGCPATGAFTWEGSRFDRPVDEGPGRKSPGACGESAE